MEFGIVGGSGYRLDGVELCRVRPDPVNGYHVPEELDAFVADVAGRVIELDASSSKGSANDLQAVVLLNWFT